MKALTQPKLSAQALELVQWHEARRDGETVGREGLLVEHVKHPYHIDIDSKGNWQLWHFDKTDKSKVVARGSATDDDAAMAEATMAAFTKIPSLREFLQMPQSEQSVAKEAPKLTNLRRTIRYYCAGAAAVLWALFAIYWFFRARPTIATLAVVTFGFGLWLTHQLTAFADKANQRREKLLKAQEARTVIAQGQQQQGRPVGRPMPAQMIARRP